MSKHWHLFSTAIGATLVIMTSSVFADAAEEPLLPIERKFSTFTIRVTKTGYTHFASADKAPAGSLPAKITAINGRSATDIWMLTDNGVVLQDDGQTIKYRKAKPCGWGEYNSEYNGAGTRLYRLVVDANEVHVVGQTRDLNTRIGSEAHATMTRNGNWSCAEKSLIPDLMHSNGTLSWRAAYNMDDDVCRIGSTAGHCTTGPRFAPTHVDPPRDSIDMGIQNLAMWMLSPVDGWVVTLDEFFLPVLYRFNGITWTKHTSLGNARIYSMWVDERSHVWITAGKDGSWDSPATMILHYDGTRVESIPVPASFKTRQVLGSSSKDIWFSGSSDTVYQWDGARLRQGSAPSEVSDMWVSSDGVAFFVLPDAIAFTAPAGGTH